MLYNFEPSWYKISAQIFQFLVRILRFDLCGVHCTIILKLKPWQLLSPLRVKSGTQPKCCRIFPGGGGGANFDYENLGGLK